MRLIRHEDSFIRALGFAILLEGGDEMAIELVKQELELYRNYTTSTRTSPNPS